MSEYVFREWAPALLANGYSPLPIKRGKKAPGTSRLLSKWSRLCEAPATESEIRDWSAYPCGVGVACGYGNLVAVDIDRDELRAPMLSILPTPTVIKRGRKGCTIFYRSERDNLGKRQYSSKERGGLADLLAMGSQTVIPPTLHPDIGVSYEWLSDRTLFNTPIYDLSVFTEEDQIKLERLLAECGWQSKNRKSGLSGNKKSSIEKRAVEHSSDDIDSIALGNLSAWVHDLPLSKLEEVNGGFRTVAHWRPSGSGRSLGDREPNLSIHSNGIRDFGTDEGYTPTRLVVKAFGTFSGHDEARDWLRDKLGIPHHKLKVAATHPDRRQSLEEAAVAVVVSDFFSDAAPKHSAASRAYDIALQKAQVTGKKYPVFIPIPPRWVLKVEPGVGKSREAQKRIATEVRRHRQIVYVVPRHNLAA